MLCQKLFGNSPPQEPDALKTIAEIAAQDDATAILPLSHFLTDESPLVRRTAADAIGHLMALCRPEQLVELEGLVRHYWGGYSYPKWVQFGRQDVDKLPTPRTTQAAALGLASFHWNGRIRERAVQLLDSITDGSEVPFLLIRLNDWVDAVREPARLAVTRRLHGSKLEAFIANIALVVRLLEQHRVDHGQIVQAVMQSLVTPEHEDALTDMVQSDNRDVRRSVFHAAIQLSGGHRIRLVTTCVQSTDPVIRLSCVRLATSVFALEELAAFLRQLENDPFMPVRREVLRARVECLLEESESSIQAALFDRSPAIRELARYHLRKRGQQEGAEIYRNAIRNGYRIDRAIAGIGDTGNVSDTELVLPFLQSSLTRIRLAAVIAIGRLGASTHVEPLFERLTDECPKVALAAANTLTGCSAAIGMERLWTLYCTHQEAHMRMAAVRLLDGLGSWDKLPHMIRAAADSDERIAERAMFSASRVCARVYTRRSEQQQMAIDESLREMAGRLPASFESLLRGRLCS